MQLNDDGIKRMLLEQCNKAQNAMFVLMSCLTNAPENVAIREEIDAVLNDLDKVMKRIVQ